MCMLSFYPPGRQPDLKRLQNGCEVNTDGFGFALITPRRELIVRRSMKAIDLIEEFADARATFPDGPALFHSRWATSGKVDETGCHPFEVGRDSKTVVAHNGVFFDPGKDSTMSDTAIFARYILPHMSYDKPSKRARLERYCGGNKLVILTVNPARRKQSYIIGENLGVWTQDGEWHSNHDFEGWGSHRHYGGYSAWLSDELGWFDAKVTAASYDDGEPTDTKPRSDREPWPCDLCGAVNAVDTLTLICDVCRSCQDCHEDADTACMCFYGQNPRANRLTGT